MFIDYHIHSSFSGDCNTPIEDIIKKAIELNLKEIAITDHIDYDYKNIKNDFSIDLIKYFKTLNTYKNLYKDKIKIQKGVEIGLFKEVLNKYKKDILDNDFDFIIGSIHSINEMDDLYEGKFFEGKTQKQAYIDYYEHVLEIINMYEDFSVLGHLDIIRRYGGYNHPLSNMDFKNIIEEILKTLISKNKGIELNTSGYRYNLGDFSPCKNIFKMYKDLNGQIITLGSDSHIPNQLSYEFESSIDYLKSIGFDKLTKFEKLKPVFYKI
ncbi:MAG: histidinol-phosphatase HisJ family protein [Peptostreptococcaceae bacterium]|jgi:histidinol-phosphatase (PHP family)|nr:histidinol-phosphatase HisJ family protein [Peptostreptococcaceae bacterium]